MIVLIGSFIRFIIVRILNVLGCVCEYATQFVCVCWYKVVPLWCLVNYMFNL